MGGSKRVPADRGPYGSGNERAPSATVDGDRVTIHDVRDFRYHVDAETEERWIDETVDVRELTNLWVYFIQFSKIRAVAHTELCFEFADGRCLIASFEVRTLKGQRYSIVAGMGKTFEMVLRWATERDVLTKRMTKESNLSRTYMFEADITHGRLVELFESMIGRTNELHAEPEWYNSVTNTCTTAIMELVHEVIPGQVKRTPRVLLPGMLPKVWADRGVIKCVGPFEEAYERGFVTDRVREIGDVPDLSVRLHQRGPFRP